MPFCPGCGTSIAPEERFCRSCGYQLTAAPPSPPSIPIVSASRLKGEGTAAALAVVPGLFGFLGIGQIYASRIGRGFVLLIVGWILDLIALFTIFPGFVMSVIPIPIVVGLGRGLIMLGGIATVIAVVLWFWSIFDAYNLTKEYNRYLSKHGKPPW